MLRNFKYQISLLYIIIGSIWILTTDRLAFYLFKNPETIEQVSNFKGWLFVILSGLVIYLLTNKELSRRNKIEQELINAKHKAEESDNLKSAFLANMSHEIRTPMNAIMGFAELLDDPDYSLEQRLKFQNIIKQRSRDLLDIINDILDISKIDAKQMKLYYSSGNVSKLLVEVKDFFDFKKAIEFKDIEIKINNNLSADQSLINTDIGRLKQILTNLVSNAFKFTDEGSIEIGCNLRDDNFLIFYVKDTGIGIPKERQAEIFERFHQVQDKNMSKNVSGNGLGLTISKGLIELLKGEIWIESNKNQGSIFYFTIPYEHIKEVAELNKTVQNKIYNWQGKTILIVEDDANNIDLFQKFLSSSKANLLFAKDGQIAMDMVNNNTLDLILMDICLPDIDGHELIKKILDLNKEQKIITQTAFANASDKELSEAKGCVDYISKPIKRSDLLKLIDKHILN